MIQQPVTGLQDALRVINNFDKTLRRQFTRDFKQAVAPVVEAAQANVPTRAPLSGWERNWKGRPLWDGAKEDQRIKLKLNTRRTSNKLTARSIMYQTVGAVTVLAQGRGLAVFDMAGRRNRPTTPAGARLIDQLNGRFRSASRAMWPAADEALGEVTRNTRPIVDRAVADANRLLRANPTVRVRR